MVVARFIGMASEVDVGLVLEDDLCDVIGGESPDQLSLTESHFDILPNAHPHTFKDKQQTQGNFGGGFDDCVGLSGVILDNLLNEAVASACLDAHQTAKLGLMFLYTDSYSDKDELSEKRGSPRKMRRDSECSPAEFALHDSKYTDVFGQQLASASKIPRAHECQCPECGRSLAAVRFAPHLEKCMGMGRNSSRVASRRLMLASGNGPPSEPSSTPRTRIADNNVQSESTEDSSEAGEEDDDWTGGRRKQVPPRRKQLHRRPIGSSSNEKRRVGKSVRVPPTKLSPQYPIEDPLLSNYGNDSRNAHLTFDMLNESPADCESPGTESLQLRSRKVKKADSRMNSGPMDAVVSLSRIQTQPMLTNLGTRAHVLPFNHNYLQYDHECHEVDDVLDLMETVDTSAFEQLSRDMASFHSVT